MIGRLVLVLVVGTVVVSAQPPARPATNLGTLVAFPAYFHLRPVLVVATVVVRDDGQLVVSDGANLLPLVVKAGTPEGPSEVRGELWDLGRFKLDDPRLAGVDLKRVFHVDSEDAWPRPGEALALAATAVTAATPPASASIRTIVLNPTRYLDQIVTIVGQFQGRNLGGDLPDAPGLSRYDFVLRAIDAAIWVTGIQPKGQGFDLAIDRRIDTGQWLRVRGIVRQGRGLMWLEAEPGSLGLSRPPADTVLPDRAIVLPPGPPPEVVFSVPTSEETDVSPRTNVRIQFSRDIDAATLKSRVRVQYVNATGAPGASPAAPIEFSTNYISANRELIITFVKPLERFRSVRMDFLEGVLGTDAQPLEPWVLVFETGSDWPGS